MSAMENNRWMVSLGGWLGNHAPTDAAGFLEFARTLAASGHLRCHQARGAADARREVLISIEPAPAL